MLEQKSQNVEAINLLLGTGIFCQEILWCYMKLVSDFDKI